MKTTPTRIPVRLLPTDNVALGRLAIDTSATKNRVACHALVLFEALLRWSERGFRLVVRDEAEGTQWELLLTHPETTGTPDDVAPQLFEVRPTGQASDAIAWIVGKGHAANRSDAIRHAISVYAAVASALLGRASSGVAAVKGSDLRTIDVPGITGGVSVSERPQKQIGILDCTDEPPPCGVKVTAPDYGSGESSVEELPSDLCAVLRIETVGEEVHA